MSTPYQGADGAWYDYETGSPIADPGAWWQSLLGTVVAAAVNKNAAPLQPGLTYHLDPQGKLVADGSTASGAVTAVASSPLLMFGVLAVGAYLLYRLAK